MLIRREKNANPEGFDPPSLKGGTMECMTELDYVDCAVEELEQYLSSCNQSCTDFVKCVNNAERWSTHFSCSSLNLEEYHTASVKADTITPLLEAFVEAQTDLAELGEINWPANFAAFKSDVDALNMQLLQAYIENDDFSSPYAIGVLGFEAKRKCLQWIQEFLKGWGRLQEGEIDKRSFSNEMRLAYSEFK